MQLSVIQVEYLNETVKYLNETGFATILLTSLHLFMRVRF